MYILSVRFPSSQKTYDYLFVNPKNVGINLKRPLRIVSGANETAWGQVSVVGKTRVEALPNWVLSQIVIDEGNICVMEKIKASHVEILSGRREKTIRGTKESSHYSHSSDKVNAKPCDDGESMNKAREIFLNSIKDLSKWNYHFNK